MMPIMDAPELIAWMKGDPALSVIPFIIVTSLPETTVRARAEGFVAYCKNPSRSTILLKRVAGICLRSSGKWRPSAVLKSHRASINLRPSLAHRFRPDAGVPRFATVKRA
jgi:CheY-like chemotaxis protein